jgi:hypothetical protein
MSQDLRAFFVGVGIFAAFALAWLAFGAWGHDRDVPELVALFAFISFFPGAPLLSGLVCGYLARQLRSRTLIAVGISAALLLASLDFAWRAAGFRDDLGLPWFVGFGITLLMIVPLVIAGGTIGAILRHGWDA